LLRPHMTTGLRMGNDLEGKLQTLTGMRHARIQNSLYLYV
jgi:hypothetical protein